MRRLYPLLFPLLLGACTEVATVAPEVEVAPRMAAADVGWVEGEVFDDWVGYAPCVGEDLHVSGTVWYRLHAVLNATREVWTAQYGPRADYQAVGLTSGDVWALKPSMLKGIVQTSVQVGALGEPFQVVKITDARFDFVNQTTGATLSWPYKMLVARNAAGEVKAEFSVNPCMVR